MAPSERGIQIRIRLFGALFILAFLLIVVRAYYLQIVLGPDLQERAVQQHQKIIKLSPQRGTIYDRNGDALALSLAVSSLYADPGQVADPDDAAKKLAGVLDLSEKEIRKKLKSGRGFVWLERRLTPEKTEEIRQLKVTGLHFVPEHKRYYPLAGIAGQVIGFTGVDPKGLEGVELEYDALLQGEGGLLVSQRDARGRGLATAEQLVRGGFPGQDLYLTLDRTLQYIAEKELAGAVGQTGSVGGTVVILEPASGKVLAMASQPDYNPNAVQKYTPSDWRNRTICDSFEPGSTFKPFLMASVLEEGLFTPNSRLYCEKGSYRVGGKTIRDHKAYKTLTMSEMLKFSSNIGFAKLGKKLERERYYSYLRDFGFGQQTGIDVPGEVEGTVHPPSRWFEIDLAAISFGQGVTVTPLQLATATAAIANGGLMMQPYLVERIVDSRGTEQLFLEPNARKRVISEKTARQVRDMMIGVVEPGGTGTRAAVSGYQVGGKTGTAQKVDPVTGGYSVDKRVASFVGFVPAERPAMVILVTLDEPQGKTYGGVVAAPVFSRVAEQALRYLNIPPSEVVKATSLPIAGPEEIASVATVPSELAGDGLQMPDFRGMSYRQVLEQMERSGLNLRLSGSGRVVEQSPQPGRRVRYNSEAWVKFGA
ncbi:MAG TPA: penicillin-binding protein [Geopsychrobacteraceae bacterium]|nr:penicillin-binding protein [Geopsychrobacteraceae bacterium]